MTDKATLATRRDRGSKMLEHFRKIKELLEFLYVQRIKGFDPPTAPHFDSDTNAWFCDRLSRSKFYLEYGSGGSTLLAARLNVKTISVEGDRFYAKAVKNALPEDHAVVMLTPDIGLTKQWSAPLFWASKKGKTYVSAPFALIATEVPDLILVDGRYRVACALEAARQTNIRKSSATILFDDYVDRPHYHEIEKLLGAPKLVGRAAIFEVGIDAVPNPDAYFSDCR